jgi:glycosyltransferase involved in cell wall biosynthesis
MRIALVAPLVTPIVQPYLGGSQAFLADLAAGLALRGHDVAVFAASGSSIDGVEVVDTGVDPYALAATLFRAGSDAARADEASRAAFARVYGMVDGFDVVHNHAFDAPAIDLAPDGTVHTLHLPPQAEIADAIDRRRCVVCCVSAAQADAWSCSVTVDAVLRNGVPIERIPFGADGVDGAVFAGRLSAEKGAREAVEIARRAGTDITVVGTAYDPSYEVDAAVVDALPREKLWDVMARSRVCLCPVLWDEPFGLVAAEAQACGTPVIAFRRGALAEVVADGETGYLVDDVEGAVRALDIVDRIDRSACRRHAELRLNLADTLDAHERLYERLA